MKHRLFRVRVIKTLYSEGSIKVRATDEKDARMKASIEIDTYAGTNEGWSEPDGEGGDIYIESVEELK